MYYNRRESDHPTNAYDMVTKVGMSLVAAAQIVLIAWISYKVAPLPSCEPVSSNPPILSN